MPRFFFDFLHADERSADDTGLEFPSAEAAYLDAFRAAREMWNDMLWERRDPTLCHFEILSADRDVLFFLPFREVIESCVDRRPPRPFGALINNAVTTAGKLQRAGEDLKCEIQSIRQTLEDSRRLLVTDI